MNKECKKGITLIEALFVLGIMAIIIGMVMVLFGQSATREKANQYLEEAGTIRSFVGEIFQNTESSNVANEVDAGVIISRMGIMRQKYISNGTLIDPSGSKVSAIVNVYNARLLIGFYNIPKNLCVAIGENNWGSSSDIKNLQINGYFAYSSGSFNPNIVVSACQPKNNYIQIVYNYI